MINIDSPIVTVLRSRKEWLEREVIQLEKAISERMKFVHEFNAEIANCQAELNEIQQFFNDNVYMTPEQAKEEAKG